MTLLDPPVRMPRRPRTAPVRREDVPPRPRLWLRPKVRFTVGQYHTMIETGVLKSGTPLELLDGQLVWKDRSTAGEDPMTVGLGHSFSINVLTGLNARLNRLGCHVRIQLPISLPSYNEPEPDAAIIRGKLADYTKRHPGASDALCVIEVSDSSLAIDRGRKLRVYANSGVKLYILINLPDRVVERYAGPLIGKGRYAESKVLGPKDKVTFPTAKGKGLTVTVKSLLP